MTETVTGGGGGGFFKTFAKLTGNYLCQSLFFDKVKKRFWHMCFTVNFVNFLRTAFLYRAPLVAAS